MKTTGKCSGLLAILLFVFIGIYHSCKKDDDSQEKEKYAWVVGVMDSTGYGMILFTPDGGGSWQRQGEGTAALLNTDLYDVWAVDSKTVWAVGSNNCIVNTHDGGTTWTRIPAVTAQPDVMLVSISMIGSKEIWISGEGGTVYHSTDAGANWTVYDSAFFHSANLQGIHAVTSERVYAVGQIPKSGGDIGIITHTKNGGLTWDSVVLANNYHHHLWIGARSADKEHVIIYGGQSHYIFTEDGGLTWRSDSVPGTGGTGGADINCLTMLDAQTWWGAFDYDGIFITHNSGASWTKQNSAGPGAMWLIGIDHYDDRQAVIVGVSSMSAKGKLLTTSNGGDLWEVSYSSKSWLSKVSFIKN
jgi:photosystem II stability/assembly factor-like uncharacterized protein